MVKAILIDLDGTLVDSIPALYLVYLKFLEHYGHKGSKKEFDSLIGPSIDEIVAILKQKYHLPGETHELSLMYVSMLMLQGFNGTELFPGAESALHLAKKKNIKLGLVTSGTQALVKVCLEPLKILDLFDVIITSEDVKEAKPHPQLYQLALTKLGLRPKEAIAVEDSPAGVDAAIAAGLQVIAFNHGGKKQLPAKVPIISLANWKEISEWLQAN